MNHWSLNYTGLQWKHDFNCWDLVRLIYKNELGLDATTEFDQAENPLDVIANEKAFATVAERWQPVETPREFDVCAMGRKSIVHHVGIFIEPNFVFHLTPNKISSSDTINTIHKNYKTVRFYRHALSI
jgi:cell wall-associated NlpC family hydrolase